MQLVYWSEDIYQNIYVEALSVRVCLCMRVCVCVCVCVFKITHKNALAQVYDITKYYDSLTNRA